MQNGNPVKFRFEINGKEMKIYNGDTGKLCLDLIQMPAEWTVLYEDFVIKNTIPAGLYLPEEYLKRKNGGSLEGDVPAMEDVTNIEHAEEAAESETPNEESKTDFATETTIEKNDDFVFPFIQVGFGIILIIIFLPIILVIVKKKKAGKE